VTGYPLSAQATPPKKVSAEFNVTTRTLSVAIDHPTLMRGFHHIGAVEITLNGKPSETARYDTQPGNIFTYTYQINAKPGDVLEVNARCNLYGSKTASITVPKP
jgi:desulfoferrodoxin (superoxide reductase-like protein)